ncbi:hypothetical protein TREMEDRAFT_26078 [Tremella mesenterica DSM 1558]|uniref:uncharacterized protein n=1 Tax=Tremella mesenterica (strain ATCC 24925 / CBS 8224 / DSM 1558 / NBRC 9311 / NRRL Y-6157 / RJB 2259-6 / UBC 559-6) TaxID=578456 RepID=UPI0003F48EDD|nr:uncharacterized protein TREMEDRAFT_26078 [Tremella mesenterica DSM 1558]EIW72393.1 hypothetical protein TREMEDRAFT_26078 [Tremella mesenterica DSM 1558]
MDLIVGTQEDEEVEEVREELLGVTCAKCSHLTCHDNVQEPESVTELRRTSRSPLILRGGWNSRGFLTFDGRTYVPDYADARLKIMKMRHDSVLAGHPGSAKTLELVLRDYVWVGVRKDVEDYIAGCAVCQRAKTNRQRSHGELKPLEVATKPWSSISMDFIEELPNSHGYNSILVVVDRLTKWAIFIPTTTKLTAAGLSELIMDYVVAQHGLPENIVSDRGSKFTSKFWKNLTDSLGIRLHLSTAYHPQTDGQTERTNQSLELYLRIFTSYQQNDWSKLLARASFAYNNTHHSAINKTPFYANYGYHPLWAEEIKASEVEVPAATVVVKDLTEIHKDCIEGIEKANERYAEGYNRKHRATPNFVEGDLVMLSLENIKTKRPMKKLDVKQSGPYKVVRQVGSHACKLELPGTMAGIHDVFHVSLLRPYHPPVFPGQQAEPPGPVEVDNVGESWEVKDIVDSRVNKRSGKLEYLVEWLGYEGTDDSVSWEPVENVDGADDILAKFHELHPTKPKEGRLRRARR